MEKDLQEPTVEQLLGQLAAMKAQYESTLAVKENEIGLLKERNVFQEEELKKQKEENRLQEKEINEQKEEIKKQAKEISRRKKENDRQKEELREKKEELDKANRLGAWLLVVLGEIAHLKRSMLTEAMRYVTDINEPLARHLQRLINATVRRMAAFARSVSRARPERKIGGESIHISHSGNATGDTEVENATAEKTEVKNTTGENAADENATSGTTAEITTAVDSSNTADNINIDSQIGLDIDEAELNSIPAKPAKAVTTLMGDLQEEIRKRKLEDEYLGVLAANASVHTDIAEPTARGRRINMPTLTRVDETVEVEVTKCPKCGTPIEAVNPETREHIIEDLGELIDMVKAVRTNLTAMRGGAVRLGYHAYRCAKCGTIFSGRPENADHPVCPGREISTDSILEIIYGQSLGFSINAAGKDFERNAKLGGNTIASLMHDVDRYVMEPTWNEMMKYLSAEEAIGADETPFAVKQAMGVGRLSHKKRYKMPFSSLTYILAVGSMRRSPTRIEGYIYLPGRSAEDIAAALRNIVIKALSSDGYAGYNKTLAEHPGALHQICLVHWRRGLMDNLYDLQIVKDCLKLPREKRRKFLLGQFERKTPLYLILVIFRAISHIYGHERSIDDLEAGSPEIEAIRVKQRALMDLISKIVKNLAETLAAKNEDKRQTLSSGSLIGASCAFYLKHEKEMRTFLNKGNYLIEPDNNLMERAIRPLAVIRNVSHFWTSPEYARGTLARLSVLRTLELNGIDPLAWCQKLCGAVYDHIAAKLIDYYWEDTGKLTAKVGIRAEADPDEPDNLTEKQKRYRLSELTKDFPFSQWVARAFEEGRRNKRLRS